MLPLVPDIPLFIAEERPLGWGDCVPWHRRERGECGGLGDTGGRDSRVAARVFAAWADAASRHHQDPVRAAAWRGAASGARE